MGDAKNNRAWQGLEGGLKLGFRAANIPSNTGLSVYQEPKWLLFEARLLGTDETLMVLSDLSGVWASQLRDEDGATELSLELDRMERAV